MKTHSVASLTQRVHACADLLRSAGRMHELTHAAVYGAFLEDVEGGRIRDDSALDQMVPLIEEFVDIVEASAAGASLH